jgi:hypothetical protein
MEYTNDHISAHLLILLRIAFYLQLMDILDKNHLVKFQIFVHSIFELQVLNLYCFIN